MKLIPVITSAFLAVSSLCAETTVLLPDSEKFAKNEKDIFVETKIPGDFTTIEGLLAALLFLSDQAENGSLSNPFLPQAIRSTSHFKGASPLGAYFRGVKREGKTITISFSSEAMRYLNNTVSIAHCTKGAMERTLLRHYPSVTNILYRIDGKVISDWDA